ncbi:MAG: hypothetical protein K2I70_02765 [Bacilli bacterium]|nr:hypothetical protein [Bacilli bacterium]
MLKKQVITTSKKISREYLQQSLNNHKNIISRYAYEYLECLINLDISVLKNGYITEEEFQYLMQLDLVQNIAKYNLYEGAYKIFQEDSNCYDIFISPKDEKREYLKVLGINDKEQFIIFDYQVLNDLITINLYHILESPSNREKEINDLVRRIDDLYDNQARHFHTPGEKTLQERIREYQSMRHELLGRTSLTGKKAQTLEHFNNRILSHYGFSSSAIPPKESNINQSGNMAVSLTKKYPSINLTQNIKYY